MFFVFFEDQHHQTSQKPVFFPFNHHQLGILTRLTPHLFELFYGTQNGSMDATIPRNSHGMRLKQCHTMPWPYHPMEWWLPAIKMIMLMTGGFMFMTWLKKNISHVHKHHTIQKINIDADNNSFLETNPPTCNWRQSPSWLTFEFHVFWGTTVVVCQTFQPLNKNDYQCNNGSPTLTQLQNGYGSKLWLKRIDT